MKRARLLLLVTGSSVLAAHCRPVEATHDAVAPQTTSAQAPVQPPSATPSAPHSAPTTARSVTASSLSPSLPAVPEQVLRIVWVSERALTDPEKRVADALGKRLEKTLGMPVTIEHSPEEEETRYVKLALDPATERASLFLPRAWERSRTVAVVRTHEWSEASGTKWKMVDVPLFVRPPQLEPAFLRTSATVGGRRVTKLHINYIKELYAMADWIVDFVRMNEGDGGAP